ncbi:MAG: FAD-dependent oxidoreductase, partial [Clostridia bacterium]|nr:FAD-dependent oxidoreductase [Clostridia bacterium]
MIRTDITLPISYTSDDIIDRLLSHLPIGRDEIKEVTVVRRTLNLSDKSDIHYKATVALSLDYEREKGLLRMRKKVRPHEDLSFSVPECKLSTRPVVVGAGPAGLFAALVLAEAGARPILYERGMAIEDRDERVKLFTALGILDPECNIQFGEGGAGAYSDGKLKSGAPDKYKLKVLCEFVNHGAPEDIIYSTGAHVGTDKLSRVVRGIREKIISLGGEVHFSSKLVDVKVNDGRVVGGRVEISGESCDFETDTLILATGHSARDVFSLLKRLGALLEPRGFGIGVRVEHPRENIDRMIYGDNPPSGLGAASY